MKNYTVYTRLLKQKSNLTNDKITRSLIYPIEIFNNISESEKIEVNTVYGKIALPIAIFEKILEDRVCYKVLEKNLRKVNCKKIPIVSIDKDGICEKKAEISKRDIVKTLIDVVLSQKDTISNEKLDKCQRLTELISYDKFLKKKGNEIVNYISYRGKYAIKVSDIMEILSLPEKELTDLLKEDSIKGIPTPEFMELVEEALLYGTELQNYIMPPQILQNKELLDKKIDSEVIQFDDSEQPSFIKRIIVNEMLWEEIWDKIPEEFNQLEKAYYIYNQLCKIFSFDEEVFINADEKKTSTPHNLARLQTINKNNPEVLCYEFAAIYSKFLEALNIHYNIAGGTTYGPNHIFIEFAYKNFYIIADSTRTIINGDLSLAKRGNNLQGFFLSSAHSNESKQKFEKELTRVREYIKKGENKDIEFLIQKKPTEIASLNLEEKKEIFFKLIENSFLKPIDEIGYILELQYLLFPKESNKKCKTCFIRDNYTPNPSNDKKSLATIICFYDDEECLSSPTEYYIYKPGFRIERIEKEILEEKFANKELSYINNGYTLTTIPGIRREQSPQKTLRHPTTKKEA